MDLNQMLLSPPIAFVIAFLFVAAFSSALSRLAYKSPHRQDNMKKSYACGEDVPTHLIQPDYTQFFPFAFFFTILHVIALIAATVPFETFETFTIAVIYILGAIVGLSILFRR